MIGEAIREYYLSTLIIKSAKRKPNAWKERMELSGNRLRKWHRRQNKFAKVWQLARNNCEISSKLFQLDLHS